MSVRSPTVAVLTREFPPDVYGGAGVHVEHLTAALAKRGDFEVAVHCFGAPRSSPLVARAYTSWSALDGPDPHLAALRTISVDLTIAAAIEGAALVHSHTWYANLGGHLGKLIWGIPHVMTTHSLEPLRPWKAEQLGGGYGVSSFCERSAIEAADAIVAVSRGMRNDILACYPKVEAARVVVIHNGIDPDVYRPDPRTHALEAHGIDPNRPYVVFLGRITRQKGLTHLLDAAPHIEPGVQLVLCAGEADTPALLDEVRARVQGLRRERGGVVWIERMLPRTEVAPILSHARAFVCPSVYEPFGIVNLEAMACGAPVVASAVGGIPEIVVEGETGFLVPFEAGDDVLGSPADPEVFARALADRVNRLVDDPGLARRMGEAGRQRVLEHFSWTAIAEQTAALYARLLAGR